VNGRGSLPQLANALLFQQRVRRQWIPYVQVGEEVAKTAEGAAEKSKLKAVEEARHGPRAHT
jgi:hypothetical protein